MQFWLIVLAYNLGNLWRLLVLPRTIAGWSLTSLQQWLVRTGGRLIKHARYYWDIRDALNPKQISHWKTASTGVHRLGYPGGNYVNLAANMPGYRGQILVFLDISDPKNPKEAGRWWERGQKESEPSPATPISFHGPAIIDGNRAYLGYSNEVAILDISDISNPKTISELQLGPSFRGGIPVHDVLLSTPRCK